MGGGSQKSTTTADPETQKTTKLVREEVLTPLVNEFMPQWIQTLIGKPGKVPVVGSQQNAMQPNLASINNTMARSGLAGTPYARRQVNEATSTAEKGQASVGPNLMMELFQQVPGMITGTSNNILNMGKGLGTTKGSSNDGGAGAAQMGTSLASAAMMAWAMY